MIAASFAMLTLDAAAQCLINAARLAVVSGVSRDDIARRVAAAAMQIGRIVDAAERPRKDLA